MAKLKKAYPTQYPHTFTPLVQTLNGDLSVMFKRWYPDMDIEAEEMPAAA